MKYSKMLVGLIFGTIFMFHTAVSSADSIKIAFVDMARALMETDEGKAEMKKLTKTKNKLQTKIEKKEKDIKDMQDLLQKQKNILEPAVLQKKAEEYYQSLSEMQQMYYQFQRDLAAKEMKVQQEIYAKMAKILEQIGKSDSYTMIYDRSVGAVVWAPSHLDLTDKLIQKYNSKHKPKKGKKGKK